MTKGLDDRVEEITQHATEHGWTCVSQPVDVNGLDEAVGVGGVFNWLAEGEELMFTIAFGINPQTGRVIVLHQGAHADARFVIAIEDGSGRYWHGPAKSWRTALADPLGWCNLQSEV